MSDAISTFFDAWQLENNKQRLDHITNSTTADICYSDPRTPEALSGINALNEYVGMFSNNAPGWSASVVKNNASNGMNLVTVAFSGNGPDGKMQTQYGQYFIEMEGELIARMVGFVGTGEPE
ncbi:MAG: hypothetical protein HWE10_08515 [Gammaproteobacteria bacterium]|nr:hypothetical protein [Gammaproteobacteria bacterium]